jgi:hypothetical protein
MIDYDGPWKEAVEDLFEPFLLMRLPDELETALYEETKTIEETTAMPYITTAERIGLKRGVEQGIAQGIEQGI